MNKEELLKTWKEFNLNCRISISPEYAIKFCNEINISFDESLIYSKLRYREQSDGHPRVDCEDLLIYVCELFKIEPEKKWIETANKMFGEGSRRSCVQKAYIGEE